MRALLSVFSFLVLSSSFACNSFQAHSTLQATRAPSFPVQEWKKHSGGPQKEPYFLQDQLYSIQVDLEKMPNEKLKTNAVLKITDSRGELLGEHKITIKYRGFTSLDNPKKQYGITVVNDEGKGVSTSLLGMPAAEDWVISAPYNDKSLLRDILSYNVSNLLGRQAARTRILDLTLNVSGTTPERMGIFVLTEKNTIGKGRIDIPKKNEAGTSFLATFDHHHDGDNIVWSGRETELILEYPALGKITAEQSAEFLGIFNDVESRVSAASGPAWDSIFDERLDLSSAVDFFIVQELSKNIDGFRLSSSFYIPPKGKIFFGPIWDFNIAYGNAAHERGFQYKGWRSQEKGVWFGPLLSHPVFCEAVKKRWIDARLEGSVSNDTLFHIIDQHALIMAPLAAENFAKWPSLGRYLWPNAFWLPTWEEEIDALKSWISLRTLWMDDAVNQLSCAR